MVVVLGEGDGALSSRSRSRLLLVRLLLLSFFLEMVAVVTVVAVEIADRSESGPVDIVAGWAWGQHQSMVSWGFLGGEVQLNACDGPIR